MSQRLVRFIYRKLFAVAILGLVPMAVMGQSDTPPTADAVSPSNGYGVSGKFSFRYSSVSGSQYLGVLYGLINNRNATNGGCRVEYLPASNRLYLFNDVGNDLMGPLTPGASGNLSNSQCSLDASASSVEADGDSEVMTVTLSFSQNFAGPQNVYGLAFDTAGANSGWQLLGTWNTSGLQVTSPTADAVSPSSGYGTSQRFTFRYSSVNGYEYLNILYGLVGGNTTGPGGCDIEYVPSGNQLYLINDAGTAVLGPVTPGVAGSLSNSQCTLDASISSVAALGNSISVTAALSFAGTFAGPQNVYGLAFDSAGNKSGWQGLGTWNTAGQQSIAPTADSVSPGSGYGVSQTFKLQYTSVNGNQYLNVLYALISATSSAAGGCQIEYLPAGNRLYLFSDAGTALLGPVTPGVAGMLSNSQCSLDAGASSISRFGNSIQVSAALTFGEGFAGSQNVYGLAFDVAGKSSGWQQLGTWNTAGMQAAAPTVDGVSPASGYGTSQAFSFHYSSVNGYGYLNRLYGWVNSSSNGPGGCEIEYVSTGNQLYLINDAGTGLTGPGTPGTPGTLSNSQCSLDVGASSVLEFGNSISVTAALGFSAPFAGAQNVYGLAFDSAGKSKGWQLIGGWNTAGLQNLAPSAAVSPSSGSGAGQTFTFQYYSANGNQYLKVLYALINSGTNGAGGCEVEYLPVTNRLYLLNDAGSGFLGPATPGMAGILSNSQCSLDVGSSSATGLANSIALKLALGFSDEFGAVRNLYGLAYDLAGNRNGWQLVGTWNTAGAPSVVSLAPSSGSGLNQIFTAVYSDAYSATQLASVAVVIGPVPDFGYCTTVYVPSTNSLFLYADDGETQLGPVTPGASGSVSNSQCTLNAQTSSVSISGNTVTVKAAIVFSSTDVGTPKVWLLATRNEGEISGYAPFGSWTPNAAAPFFPLSNPTTAGVTVSLANQVTTPSDISATNDPTVWVTDIGSCSASCFSVVQDPSMGSTILANWISSGVVQQADISTGSGNPVSTGEWDLSQKNTLTHYLKYETSALTDPTTNLSVLDHYVLLYDQNGCYREWFISGTDIPLGQWVQISVADIHNGPYYSQSCPLDFSHIVYSEIGIFGPNIPFNAPVALQLASVGSE